MQSISKVAIGDHQRGVWGDIALGIPRDVLTHYCERSLHGARQVGATMLRVTIPVPAVSLLTKPDATMLFCPAQGAQFVGSGQAVSIRGFGEERFSHIQRSAERVWKGLYDAPMDSNPSPPPRFFGGLSFSHTSASDLWRDFGQALFWIPQSLYCVDGDRAWLSLCIASDIDLAGLVDQLATEQREMYRVYLESDETPSLRTQPRLMAISHLEEDRWASRISSIHAAIETGQVDKVVAARRSHLQFQSNVELLPMLEGLGEQYPDCFRYAFHSGTTAFVGASPETLVDKCGTKILTQALAGSIAASENSGRELLASKKDRMEQELVVRAIAEVLAPLCGELEYPDTPQIRTFRHISHLYSPIRGLLREPGHVLDILKALHPTPAVGGTPRREAMQWIAQNEDDRGWYAGPVGTFDIHGDGVFAVALRSSLIAGRDAFVYTGAGIVADSDSHLEYRETGLKQRAILDALDVAE